jgi:hypothetical protein
VLTANALEEEKRRRRKEGGGGKEGGVSSSGAACVQRGMYYPAHIFVLALWRTCEDQ